MTLILRIDVDRPYGKKTFFHHVLSRIASDFYFPRINRLNYLKDLEDILSLLNQHKVPSYIFFRRCTIPSQSVVKLMNAGGHVPGLHLENSRSLKSFQRELYYLRKHTKCEVITFSKHGSGFHRYGLFHFPPYEPEKYQAWGLELGMKVFLGNQEDPTIKPYCFEGELHVFPSAFWLEPNWRDTKRYTIDWLCKESRSRNIVLLLHPDNVTADVQIMGDFLYLIENSTFSLVD